MCIARPCHSALSLCAAEIIAGLGSALCLRSSDDYSSLEPNVYQYWLVKKTKAHLKQLIGGARV